MLVSMMAQLHAGAMATNSAYAGMAGKQSLLALANRSSASNVNATSFGNEFLDRKALEAMHRQEKQLTSGMLNNELLYKISNLQYQAWRNVERANIQRAFSTFA